MAEGQSEVEQAIVTLVSCFYKHAGEEGQQETLTSEEFNKLLNEEFPQLTQDVSLEDKLKELDLNKDNELNFKEYWRLIGELAKAKQKDLKDKKK
ncbi:protein S100-A13-like [Xenopus laevis]|uniref:Protein S100-A13-like n=1 Tax=Xenopus laevis TaxID=8355 RepID=A0A8J1LLX8_XENLA|nr:protein S100-A13-like [Xenopus laevis]XP_041430523.1 protein S100-A13-like [Xenopus laevis]